MTLQKKFSSKKAKKQGLKALQTFGLAALTFVGTGTTAWAQDAPNSTLPEVTVTGQKTSPYLPPDTLSLGRYTQPLNTVPQSVSVVPKQVLEDQHATTLKDAIRNVAGISIAAGEGGAQGDNFTLRGFSGRNDIFLDGMRDFGSYYRDSFNYDHVEALKGPASVAFGRGSTGGVINQVSKEPEKKAHTELDFALGTANKKRATLDYNQPLSPEIGFRLNALVDNGNVDGRDVVETKHYGLAPTLTFGMGGPTQLTLSHLYEQSDDIPDYGIPWLFNAPAPVDRSTYYGFKSDFLKTVANVTTAKLEHEVNPNLNIKDQLRFGRYTRIMRATEPKIAGSPTQSTPIDTINITRNALNTDSTETYLGNQFDVTTKFKTWDIDHTVVVGTEISKETSSPVRYTISGVPGTTLTAPNPNETFAGTYAPNTNTNVISDGLAFYGLDTIAFNPQWEVVLGSRWDQFSTQYTQNSTSLSQTDRVTSYRGAITYKPTEDGSIYVGMGNSFDPSAESLSLSSGSANLAPEQNTSIELGTKWQFFKRQWTLRTAIFRTEKTNARETDPNDSSVVTTTGTQRVDGFEIEGSGALTKAWQLSFGYAYLQSALVSSQQYPSAVGNPLANVPAHTFTLWTTYTLPSNWIFGAGTQYVSSRRANSTKSVFDTVTGLPREVPSYWVFNAMAGYPITKNLDLQLNINNIFDVTYYDQVHNAHIIPGQGRSIVLSGKYKF